MVRLSPGWSANIIADLLSSNKVIGKSTTIPSYSSSLACHSASRVAAPAAMYSASMLDNATVVCVRLCHDTDPPVMKKMYPVVLLRKSTSAA